MSIVFKLILTWHQKLYNLQENCFFSSSFRPWPRHPEYTIVLQFKDITIKLNFTCSIALHRFFMKRLIAFVES